MRYNMVKTSRFIMKLDTFNIHKGNSACSGQCCTVYVMQAYKTEQYIIEMTNLKISSTAHTVQTTQKFKNGQIICNTIHFVHLVKDPNS